MEKFPFIDKGPKLTNKALAAFEQKLGSELPADYKAFVWEVNGGTPEDDLCFAFVEDGTPTETVIGQFYTLAKEADDLYTLHEVIETFVQAGRMPSWFLPVADDAFGNQICLSLAEHEFGAVYFWNHELEPDIVVSAGRFPNVSRIADSFAEFLGKLERMTE